MRFCSCFAAKWHLHWQPHPLNTTLTLTLKCYFLIPHLCKCVAIVVPRSFTHPLFLFLALIYRQSSGCTSIYMHRSAFIHLDVNKCGEWVTFYMQASWRLMKVDGDCGIKFVDMHAFADLSDHSFIKTCSFTRTRIYQICILREFHLLTQTIFPTLMRYNLPSHVGK